MLRKFSPGCAGMLRVSHIVGWEMSCWLSLYGLRMMCGIHHKLDFVILCLCWRKKKVTRKQQTYQFESYCFLFFNFYIQDTSVTQAISSIVIPKNARVTKNSFQTTSSEAYTDMWQIHKIWLVNMTINLHPSSTNFFYDPKILQGPTLGTNHSLQNSGMMDSLLYPSPLKYQAWFEWCKVRTCDISHKSLDLCQGSPTNIYFIKQSGT